MSLKKYIEEKNVWPKITGKGTVFPENPKDLTATHAKSLYESLEGALSPENLHCDGEISHAQAMAKYRRYHKAIEQLEALGFPSEDYYLD